MAAPFALALGAMALGLAACDDSEVSGETVSGPGFEFPLAEDYEVRDGKLDEFDLTPVASDVLVVRMGADVEGMLTSLSVDVAEGKAVDSARAAADEVDSQGEGAEFLSGEPGEPVVETTLGGEPGTLIEYERSVQSNTVPGEEVLTRGRKIFVPLDGDLYEVTYLSPAKTFDDGLAGAELMLGEWAWTE